MLEWLLQAIGSMGVGGVFALMFLENVFPPIPSEMIMPAAGWAAARGEMPLLAVIIAGSLGSLLGTLPWYWLGRRLGKERLRAWADRHGRWIGTDGDDIEHACGWFERRGTAAVLLGRLVPGVRTLISIPAGVAAMPLGRYLAVSAVGTTAWVTALALLGRALGAGAEQVGHWVSPIGNAVLGLLVVLWVVRAIRKGRRRSPPDTSR